MVAPQKVKELNDLATQLLGILLRKTPARELHEAHTENVQSCTVHKSQRVAAP